MVAAICSFSALNPVSADGNGEMIALAINQSGNLCAKVLSVAPLKIGDGQSVFEVVCVEYRGGSDTVTYLVDTRTETPIVVRK